MVSLESWFKAIDQGITTDYQDTDSSTPGLALA